MRLTIKWNKESFAFECPSPDTKLAVVRQFTADKTGLDYDAFKLICAGAVMKDNEAPISSYRLSRKPTIQVIGLGSTDSSLQTSVRPHVLSDSSSEQSIVQQIHLELSSIRETLGPEAVDLVTCLSSGTPITEQIDKDRRRIGELLLQALLRLDAIQADSEWLDARRERKAAVKEVQALLDSVDDEWAKRK